MEYTYIRKQESNRTHEILRLAHLALRDERSPLRFEIRVVIKDLLGAVVTTLVTALLEEALSTLTEQ
jgi:hypothetical protein